MYLRATRKEAGPAPRELLVEATVRKYTGCVSLTTVISLEILITEKNISSKNY